MNQYINLYTNLVVVCLLANFASVVTIFFGGFASFLLLAFWTRVFPSRIASYCLEYFFIALRRRFIERTVINTWLWKIVILYFSIGVAFHSSLWNGKIDGNFHCKKVDFLNMLLLYNLLPFEKFKILSFIGLDQFFLLRDKKQEMLSKY